jgi:BirA family biotin operon repressor/biotin-[acetyl-CoA-carboxylase] ligase
MSTLENTPYLSPVSDDSAKTALEGTRFGDLRWVDRTGSTNADLVAAARGGAGECALVADHQDAGRGRLDRRWEAPPGASLLMSVLVRPPFPATGPHLLATAMGLAAVDALAHLGGIAVGLKWPNDVVAPGAGGDGSDLKLGGLLAELSAGEGGDAVIVGIGLNLAWAQVGFPAELAATATSVDLLGGSVGRDALVVELLGRFDALTAALEDPSACEALVGQYRARCVTLGRDVRVVLPVGELVGTAVGLGADGSLEVRGADGTNHTVTVGDVVHLRPL